MHSHHLNLNFVKNWQWLIILLLLVFVPINSKLAGACWLAFCLLGAWYFKRGSARRSTAEFDAAKVWVFACLSALSLRAVTQFYWGDSWGERHAEFRLLFGSLGLLGLVHYARFTSDQLKWLGYSLVLALWAGFGWMLVFGPALAPTNQIPWGASMSLLVCVVLAQTLGDSSQSMRVRFFYASGVAVGVCAVLLSQARGAYGIVFWVVGVVLWHYARSGIKWQAFAIRVVSGVVAITVMLQMFPQLISIPAQRIQLAVDEFLVVDSAKELGINTSVGARIYLWKRAVEEVPDHLLMGVGREERMASIQRWGDDANSPTIKGLGHLHNNYVHDLFEQGLIGFAGFLAYILGLLFVAIRLRKFQPTAALGIVGVIFMHSTSSFTNVNFAHNYYPTCLSIAVFLCFILLIKRDIFSGEIN